jgi:aspartyl-tRNA(Asn)/glutamyl-tRNA(Gln) amidotransferase subunit C
MKSQPTISLQEVEYIASLACLNLSQEEKKLFLNQLNEILEYMKKLNEVPTDDIPPTTHVLPIKNVLREDKQKQLATALALLKDAPSRKDNFFKVPKIIEET